MQICTAAKIITCNVRSYTLWLIDNDYTPPYICRPISLSKTILVTKCVNKRKNEYSYAPL